MTSTTQLGFAGLVRRSLVELVLTSALLFGVTTIVRFVVGPSLISHVLPQIHIELLIIGAAVAILLAGLIKSPQGNDQRRAHESSYIARDVALRRVSRSGIGAIHRSPVTRVCDWCVCRTHSLGAVVERPPVLYAVVVPAPALSPATLFLAELIIRA